MRKYNVALFFIYGVYSFSCSSFNKSKSIQNEELKLSDGAKVIRCESQALVKDLKNNKSHRLNIDLLAIDRQRLRIEVSGTLGYNVASILFDDNGTKYVSYPEKKFYQIKNSEKSLNKLIKVPLSTSQFYDVVYGSTIKSPNWRCSKDSMGRVVTCVESKEQINISWQYFETGEKTIQIASPLVEVNWKFKKLNSEATYNPAAFVLDPPSGYKINFL